MKYPSFIKTLHPHLLIPKFANRYWFLIISVFSSIFFFLPQINDYYIMDEAAFPYGAKGVSENWTPAYYNGELSPANLALWHPPFYVYILGLWIKIFGGSYFAVRGLNLLLLILLTVLVWKCVRLYSPPNSFLPANIASSLVIGNHFILQGGLIPDIDGAMLPVVTFLLLYKLLSILKKTGSITSQDLILIAIILALNFSVKITTSLMLIPAVFMVTYFKSTNKINSIFRTTAVVVFSTLIVMAWWIPLSKIQGLNWKEPFLFTFNRISSGDMKMSMAERLMSMFIFDLPVFSWIGTLTFLSIALTTLVFISNFEKMESRIGFVVNLFALINWFFYNAISGAPFTFPKYWNVGVVLSCLGIGFALVVCESNLRQRKNKIYATIAILIFALHWILRPVTLDKLENLNPLSTINISFLALILTMEAIRSHQSGKIFKNILALGLVVTTILISSQNFFTNFRISQSTQSVRYFFGESSMGGILNLLKSPQYFGRRIMAAKDIGLQSGSVFYEDAVLFSRFTPSELNEFLLKENIELIVVREKWDYSPIVYKEYFDLILEGYVRRDAGIKDFQLWERNK